MKKLLLLFTTLLLLGGCFKQKEEENQNQSDYLTISFCELRGYHWKYQLAWKQEPQNTSGVLSSYPVIVCDPENKVTTGSISKIDFQKALRKQCRNIMGDTFKQNSPDVVDYLQQEHGVKDVHYLFDCSDLYYFNQ